ncbi:hypothetical protein AADG42_00845 [Ammonicoccus fulvus]|uniref:ATP-binding protein n=1 Tax=Ammonicoccus fulvus TaxID=3138240 RepID=A0ABZ3FM70_9ACTN
MRFGYADDGYARLGLSGNPFVADRDRAVEPDLWLDRAGVPEPPAAGLGLLVQLVGPKGAGKTSHLLRWREAAPGPYHYVAPGRQRWAMPPVAPLVYWDEVDRLAAPVRRIVFGRAARMRATVVAGTHEDLTAPARHAGLGVVTHHFPGLTPAVLRAWCDLRIAAVTLPGTSSVLDLNDALLAAVCAEVGPSLREAAFLLHHHVAERARAAGEMG